MNTRNQTVTDAAGTFAPGRAILIRQAHVISMDDAIGDLIGDVLVKDGKIVEVAPSIEAPHAALIDGQHKVLPVVSDIFRAATRRWLAGVFSVADAEFQIKIGCELLEVPDDAVAAELERAAPDTRVR